MSRWLVLLLVAGGAHADQVLNPLVDYSAFQENVRLAGEQRKDRRVSERQFLRMAADPGTVILDARSANMFRLMHVKGARNLSFPDMTAAELARVIPTKDTRILIYCNNNFLNAPGAFPTKAIAASLNVHTLTALRSYGYTNVFELGPLIDVRKTRIEFVRAEVPGS